MTDAAPALRPYQIEGAGFAAGRANALIADPPGLGKTPQAVRWLDLIGARRAIVLTTASHVHGFAAEISRWQQDTRGVAVDDPDADVCVTTAARVAQNWNRYASRRYDALVADEAHHFKEPEAKRTRAVYGDDLAPGQGLVGAVEARGGRVLLLSGTPAPNYQTELWTHYRRLWPDMLRSPIGGRDMTHEDFIQHYAIAVRDRHSGKLRPRANRNVEQLRALNRQVAIRRTWEQVGVYMPPVQIRRTPLFASLEAALKSRPDLATELRAALEAVSTYIFAGREPDWSDPDAAASALADLTTDTKIHLSTARRLIGETKAPLCAELVEQFLLDNPGEKCVVFCAHRRTLECVAQRLAYRWPGVIVQGGMTPGQRDAAVAKFQTDAGTRWFVGNIQSAGEAITLTAAATVFMVEGSWSPKDDWQAIARCRRFGQKKSVTAEYPTIPGTIEDAVAHVVRRKADGIGALWA